ncbi:MAG: hypothetical protein AB7J28_03630 [Hyphomonadaceae bacterium]
MHESDAAFDEVIAKLKAAARANRTVEAAQVHVVNIAEIIAQAGRYWPNVRERIRAGSMSFLKGCVDEDDIVIPCGDGFLIVFARGEGSELARRSADMQELLTAYYTGEEGLETLRARIEPKTINQENIAELIASPPTPPPAREPAREIGQHRIAFAPVWSAQAEMVAAHFCLPSYCEQGVMRMGYDSEYRRTGRHQHMHYDALDQQILDVALNGLADMERRGARGIVGASVHISTLRRQDARIAYLSKLASADPALLARLVIRIAEIEAAAPPWTLGEWTGYLKQHVREVALELHHSERLLDRVSEAAPWAFGFHLPPHRRDAPESAVRLLKESVAHWARAAHKQKVRLFVDGVRSGEVLHAVQAAGAAFATSELFWPSRHDPAGAYAAPAPPRPPRGVRAI